VSAYNDDVLFIHIPKAGGTSVKRYMLDHLPGVKCFDPKRKESAEETGFPVGHIRLADVQGFTGRPVDSWRLIVAVVRNPYEQQLSQWEFWRGRYARGSRHPFEVTAATYADLTLWLRDPGSDFTQWYLRQPWSDGVDNSTDGFRFWLDVDGQIPPNVQISTKETMGDDIPRLMMPSNSSPPVVPQLNLGYPRRDAIAYYTPEGARIVEDRYKWAFSSMYSKWYYSDAVCDVV